MSIYNLKPQFQNLLRPMVSALARKGYSANQVTLLTCFISILIGIALCVSTFYKCYTLLLLLPIWMFIRMAFNAIDGMLAREHLQKSALGGYLNELTDVISDSFLYLPFYWVLGSKSWVIGVIIVLSVLTEFAGVLGQIHGNSRRYDGPMGKSDRAFVFGAFALIIVIFHDFTQYIYYCSLLVVLLLLYTIFKRIKNGLKTI